jgi:hypothetical protein
MFRMKLFLQICQQNVDSIFSLALAIPALAALGALVWLLRSPTQEELAGGNFFRDPDTGTIFETEANFAAERDRWVCVLAALALTLCAV